MKPVIDQLLPAPRARVQRLRAARIDVRGWDEIWRLASRFYDAERGPAERRLKAQSSIALFRSSADGRLVGMVAIEVETLPFEGRRVVVVVSSQAIAEPRFRSQRLLQRALLPPALQAWAEHPLKPRYWAFDAAGDHTELLSAHTAQRATRPLSAWESRLLAAVAQRRAGQAARRLRAQQASGDAATAGTPRWCLLPLDLAQMWALWRSA